jgi:hypothetical protein
LPRTGGTRHWWFCRPLPWDRANRPWSKISQDKSRRTNQPECSQDAHLEDTNLYFSPTLYVVVLAPLATNGSKKDDTAEGRAYATWLSMMLCPSPKRIQIQADLFPCRLKRARASERSKVRERVLVRSFSMHLSSCPEMSSAPPSWQGQRIEYEDGHIM